MYEDRFRVCVIFFLIILNFRLFELELFDFVCWGLFKAMFRPTVSVRSRAFWKSVRPKIGNQSLEPYVQAHSFSPKE